MTKARDLASFLGNNTSLNTINNAYDAGALSNRNLIINGAMQVAQRGTSFVMGSSVGYTLDRWKSQGTYDTESLTIEQSSDAPSGFGNSLKVSVTTAEGTADANDYHYITQKFEGQNLTQLGYSSSNAKTLTVSFWVKSSIAQTYCISLYQTNGNLHYSATYSVNSANTWEYKTVYILSSTNSIANNSTQGLEIGFMLGAGTSYSSGSSGSWGGATNFAAGASHTFMTTVNATFQFTGVQLEVGDTATPFEHRSYGEELAKCQRYFYRHADNYNRRTVAASFRTTSSAVEGLVTFPSTMRSTPTLISTSGTDYYRDYCLGNGTNLSTVSAHNLYINNAVLQWTGHPRTAGQAGYMRTNNAGATVDFDAEL